MVRLLCPSYQVVDGELFLCLGPLEGEPPACHNAQCQDAWLPLCLICNQHFMPEDFSYHVLQCPDWLRRPLPAHLLDAELDRNYDSDPEEQRPSRRPNENEDRPQRRWRSLSQGPMGFRRPQRRFRRRIVRMGRDGARRVRFESVWTNLNRSHGRSRHRAQRMEDPWLDDDELPSLEPVSPNVPSFDGPSVELNDIVEPRMRISDSTQSL